MRGSKQKTSIVQENGINFLCSRNKRKFGNSCENEKNSLGNGVREYLIALLLLWKQVLS